MTKRIFRSICAVAGVVLLAALVLIMGVLYGYFSDMQQKQLRTELAVAAHAIANEGVQFFDSLEIENRITWISADGTVLYDTDSDAAEMENHLEREEVQEAILNGYGESSRYSTTMTEQLLYSAQRLPDGSVVRLAGSQYTVVVLLLGMLQPIIIIIVIIVVLALVLASRVAKKTVGPLNELDLDQPLSNTGYDELSPLLRRLDSQQRKISEQKKALQHQKDEFAAVTSNMNEGLVLLNRQSHILSINPAAAKLLGTDESCVGSDILTVNRTLEMQSLLRKAGDGVSAEKMLEINGREYQLFASPIMSNEKISGTAILMMDVTEKEQAERMRREFTANVSHELKTPLHSISGCAELLCNDMVKPEDVKHFTRQIYTEAQRLILLVEDIIRLSRLDEGADDMKRESVDLYEIAEAVVQSLAQEADAVGVKLELTGSSAVVSGIPQLISGMIYNLCDNAVKYNREGGSVKVDVRREDGGTAVSVSDNGIGIPPEHHARIFERFYRVDKSHSKAVGGTGLGLSIVKHSARLHNARVELHSVVDEGTQITVHFPAADDDTKA